MSLAVDVKLRRTANSSNVPSARMRNAKLLLVPQMSPASLIALAHPQTSGDATGVGPLDTSVSESTSHRTAPISMTNPTTRASPSSPHSLMSVAAENSLDRLFSAKATSSPLTSTTSADPKTAGIRAEFTRFTILGDDLGRRHPLNEDVDKPKIRARVFRIECDTLAVFDDRLVQPTQYFKAAGKVEENL